MRRRMAGDAVDSVPAALPLPPTHGKRRVAFSFPSDAGVARLPPVLLHDVAKAVPTAWQPVVSALLGLGEAVGAPPRVFGALLWEHMTGLPYLSPASDLDLLWQVSDLQTAEDLVQGLLRLDADGPVRLDGEVVLPDGAGVNWRELAQAGSPADTVLVKAMHGVEARPRAGLFRTLAPAQ